MRDFSQRTRPTAIVIMSILVLCGPALAQEEGPMDMMARIEAAKDRLDLTPEQLESMRAVMDESGQKYRAVLDKHGVSRGDKLSLGKKIKIGKDMRKVQKQTDKQLTEILDKDQMKEFKAIRKEMRQEAKQRMKGN
jgi:hypothetical protein